LKLAFIVQRCGEDVIGGSEKICLEVAKRLSQNHDIEILTTCARDLMTWENSYDEGIVDCNGFKINRFKTETPRDFQKFLKSCDKILQPKHSIEDEEEWMKIQGPNCPTLFTFLKDNAKKYDLFIFFTYLYTTTYYGLKSLPQNKTILIPFAHDEDWLKLSIFTKMFKHAGGIIYHSQEEINLIENRFDVKKIPKILIGYGIEESKKLPDNFSFKENLSLPYIFYLGRLGNFKGSNELIEFFLRFKKNNPIKLKLILAGKTENFEIKKDDDIVYLGSLNEDEKRFVIENSLLFINSSPHESFSIVIMESWLLKKPVLVNGKSLVLKGHCERSNGGLYYENYEEFEECLKLLINNKKLLTTLGKNGYEYVKNNFNWDKITSKYQTFLDQQYILPNNSKP
jgi:glycosyltransferase involved in cell wall biosynthesis